MQIVHTGAVRRIAVIRMSAMGDCILLQPTLIRILQAWPEVQIDWYIDKAWVGLFPQIPRLHLLAIQKPKKISDYLTLRRQYFNVEYDIVLAMQASFRANLLYSLVKAPIKIGFDRQRARDGQWLWTTHTIAPGEDHLADGFARFADALAIPPAPMCWRIATPAISALPMIVQQAIQDQRPILGCLPAASKLERTPLPEFWCAMVISFIEHHRLNARSDQAQPLVLLLGGPTQLEQEISDKIIAQASQGKAQDLEVVSLVGQTSLSVLAGILQAVNCLVSPDSGPLHLANAVKTPVVGLYAVAPSKLSGPYCYQEHVFDVYHEAVQRFLKKKPEEVKWGTRVHERAAMEIIDPKQVGQKVATLMQ